MLRLSLFILGASSLITQAVMARELLVSFYGNEFFIGWILFSWLWWVGIGSRLIGVLKDPLRGLSLVLVCHLLLGILFPLTIIWVRLSKSFFITTAGQIPDIMPALLVSFLTMAPVCLIFGIQFVALSEFGLKLKPFQNVSSFLSRAYFDEAVGFVAGGLLFSYGLVFLNEFQTSAVFIFLNLAAVAAWIFVGKFKGRTYFLSAAVLVAFLGLMCFACSAQWNFKSAALRFPHEQLIKTKNTIYGNLAVTRSAYQSNFYESGLPVGTDRDGAFNEFLVSFPMLTSKDPQKVLLIGSGFSGALEEILAHHPGQVFYAELDPAMVSFAGSYIPSFWRGLKDPRVSLIEEDPRLGLKSLPKDLDVIIVNLPNPSTALVNRYFTDEFFKEAKEHLAPNGVMATHLKFAADSISAPLAHLGTCIYKTIKHNFPSVVILPEDELFILASSAPIPVSPKVLISRMKARGIYNYFANAEAITFRYTTDRIPMTTAVFKNTSAEVNTDMHPQGYLYNFIYWLSIFHQGFAHALSSLMRTDYLIILLVAVGLISMLLLPGDLALDKTFLVAAMFTGGFSLMSAEVIVIYGFQVFFGNLYYEIAWIISAFMAAVAVGSWLGNKKPRVKFSRLSDIHRGIGFYFVFWFLLMHAATFTGLPPLLWILLGSGIGVLIGMEFSCSNMLLFALQAREKEHLATMYAADLLGSCVGALGISVFMIPAYGVYKTILFLIIINMTLALVLSIHRNHTTL